MRRNSSTGVERLQPSMERIGIRRSKRPTHYPQQAMEAWRSYVQQVTSLETYFKYLLCLWRIIFIFGRHFLAMSVYSLHIIAACFLSFEWWLGKLMFSIFLLQNIIKYFVCATQFPLGWYVESRFKLVYHKNFDLMFDKGVTLKNFPK